MISSWVLKVSVLSYQFPFPKVLKTVLIQCIFRAIVGWKFCDLWVCDKIKISLLKPESDKIYMKVVESVKYLLKSKNGRKKLRQQRQFVAGKVRGIIESQVGTNII